MSGAGEKTPPETKNSRPRNSQTGNSQTGNSQTGNSQTGNSQTRNNPAARMKSKSSRTSWTSDESDSFLSRKEISLFRNSLKQNICVQMLQDGYHRSFSELFSLLSLDGDQRAALEPGSSRAKTPPLEEQRHKLETMKLHLSRAEEADRKGDRSASCEQLLLLGDFFSSPEDAWLSLHFYHRCTERGGCRPAAEARTRLAQLYLQQGELQQARQQAELCLQQTDHRPLRLRACRDLGEIYVRLAEAQTTDVPAALTLLHRALGLARESEHRPLEGQVLLGLGRTNQRTGDQQAARQFFSSSLEIYESLEDPDGLMRNYNAIAECLESEGQVEESSRFLQESVLICQSGGLKNRRAETCWRLGRSYVTLRRLAEAYQTFLQGYQVLSDEGDAALLKKSQVELGCFSTLELLGRHAPDLQATPPSPSSVRRVVVWKETRGHRDIVVPDDAIAVDDAVAVDDASPPPLP